MKQTLSRFQRWMTAITFAEAGEWESARQMSPVTRDNREISQVNQIFMATAFAEVGEPEAALAMLDQASRHNSGAAGDFLNSLGLSGVRVTYGVFATELAR